MLKGRFHYILGDQSFVELFMNLGPSALGNHIQLVGRNIVRLSFPSPVLIIIWQPLIA